jgi:predicted amidohydrolase
VRVAAVQLDVAWEDKPSNHAKVRALLGGSPPPPGTLVVLPEMFSTGFSTNVAGIAEGDGRPTERFLSELARERGVTTLGGVVNLQADGLGRNEAVVFDPRGDLVARYAKIHPFSLAGESRFYASGQEVVLFRMGDFTVAPFVCYDLRFPEVFRRGVRKGAQLFCVIASWPEPREAHWMALLKARAIENQAYVVGVNRCGRDPKLAYSGRSQIIDPRGSVLADAGGAEGVISCDLDLPALEAYRLEFPALADMKPGWS